MGESSSSTSLSVDSMYTQVMGPERHGRVQGFGFGATPSVVFGATSKKEANAALALKLKETEERSPILNNVKNKCNNKFDFNKSNYKHNKDNCSTNKDSYINNKNKWR